MQLDGFLSDKKRDSSVRLCRAGSCKARCNRRPAEERSSREAGESLEISLSVRKRASGDRSTGRARKRSKLVPYTREAAGSGNWRGVKRRGRDRGDASR